MRVGMFWKENLYIIVTFGKCEVGEGMEKTLFILVFLLVLFKCVIMFIWCFSNGNADDSNKITSEKSII